MAKFLFSNFMISYQENQFINLNYKKSKILRKKHPRFKINSLPIFNFDDSVSNYPIISNMFEGVYTDDYIKLITNFIKWEKGFCKSAYNYILKQSHRIPKVVHDFSGYISDMIKPRVVKEFLPSSKHGHIRTHSSFLDIVDMISQSDGDWLILGRTQEIVKELEDLARNAGVFFSKYKRQNIF